MFRPFRIIILVPDKIEDVRVTLITPEEIEQALQSTEPDDHLIITEEIAQTITEDKKQFYDGYTTAKH